jgi:glycosyltransferase involved in cell wall biosynthesis
VLRAAKRLAHLALTAWDTQSKHYDTFVKHHLFDFADHILAHADSLSHVAPGRVTVLPTPAYSLPEPAWSCSEVDARFDIEKKRVAVLFGFPQPSKGFDRAVAVLPHLPTDWMMLQVGDSKRSQAEAEKLADQAEKLGVASRFVRTGYLTDAELAAVLGRADVALAPFRSVNHSSSLGHLIGAGVPIVASRISTLERLADDGAGLQFADPDNPVSLAQAMTGDLSDLRMHNLEYTRQHGFAAVAKFIVERLGGTR